ncbi:hypothetical protein [Aeromicrobium fastidiosum]|uniref:hypothetical protein n=1 Tax=Aeromicrobium fastidiosum TaxID=52699 RepID=UPI00165F7F87|nr:hypothetical protein [Aeromicrobium fastidiosum]MBP2390930.1 hypothetical protein [Aeromicrobium fastidiosum]
MHRAAVRRVGRTVEMLPAVARIGVRRARRARTGQPAVAASAAPTAPGLTCRIDAGTSTAECSSTVPDERAAQLVADVVSSVGRDLRRIAWFVPVDDVALESALTAAGFVCEGWAAPPVGDTRQHRQWALLTDDA